MAAVTSGTVYSGYQWHSRVYVNWAKTGESIEKNETYISWTVGVQISSGDQWYSNAVKINATYINGVKVFSGGTYSNITSNGNHAKASGTATIPHTENGTKSFTASISGWFYSYGNTSTGSSTFELPSIPRVSDLSVNKTSVPADGNTTVIATATKKATAFTDVLTVSLGDYSKTITSGTAFNIPKEWNNAISGTSAVATVKVETFNGETSIGSKTADLTVTVPASVVPNINGIAISEAVASVKSAFSGLYVQNLSQLNVSIDASGAYGSTIRSYSATLDGVNYIQQAFTSNVIKTAGALEIAVKVTDSRGRTAEESISVNVVEYALPTITSMVYMHCDSDGTQNSSGNCTKVTIAGKVYPVSSKNTKALKLKYKSMADSSYTERTVTVSDWTFSVDTIINNTDPTVTYEYVAELTDKINASTPETFRVTTGVTVLSRLAGGKGITLFGEAEEEGFIIKGDNPINFTSDVARADTRQHINYIGANPITSTNDDTTTNWNTLGTGIAQFNVTGQLIDQPTQYGYVFNMVNGNDVRQMWFSLASGNVYHRGGNYKGWSGTWRKVLDETNGIQIKKLWQNASPTSTFTAQTISLDLSGYTDILVQYYVVKKDANGIRSLIVPVGDYGSMGVSSSINRARTFQVLTTGVKFEAGYYWGVYNSGSSVDNTWLTPHRIFGVKGVS